MRVSKGLKQAYDLQDFTFEATLALRESLTTPDGKLAITRAGALAIKSLVSAWESAQQRVAFHRRVPAPGVLKPSERPSKRKAVSSGSDFWENGEPDRKFQILGVVDDKRGEGIISRSGKDSALAKIAKEHGGDAVVLASSSRELRGFDAYGNANYRRLTKIIIVKYLSP